MNLHAITRLLVLITFCFLLVSCSRDDQKPVGSTSESQLNTSVAQAQKEPSAEAAISFYLMPLPATKEQGLRAIITEGLDSPVYRWDINGSEIAGVTGFELPASYFSKGDEVRVVISQGKRSGQASTFVENSPPRLIPASVECGFNKPILPETTDADGDEVSVRYLWSINGLESIFAGNTLTGAQATEGDQISLQIFISDGEMELPVYECNTFEAPNAPPLFVTTPPSSFSGHLYSYQVRAIDHEGTSVKYQLAQAPAGMEIDPQTGVIRWPITAESAGEHLISIIATDEDGQQSSQDYTLNLSLPGSS